LKRNTDLLTHVAPATTNSTVFALVEPDNTAMKAVAAVIIVKSLAVRLSMRSQTMTGASRSVTIKGVIKTRAVRVIDALGIIWTLGSLEITR
jgi:hypothetical protein